MSFFSEEQGSELKEIFFESARELLQTLNEEGLQLEHNPGDAEIIRSVRRTVHTLKGDSAACGYREISELAHELEDVLTPELAKSKNGSMAELVLSVFGFTVPFSVAEVWEIALAVPVVTCGSSTSRAPMSHTGPCGRLTPR